MGGMQALAWLIRYPHNVQSAMLIATAAKHSPQQIAFNEVGRQAIMADSHWQNGNYYGGRLPVKRSCRSTDGRPHHLYERLLNAGEIRQAVKE